jgi:hypothetical protein
MPGSGPAADEAMGQRRHDEAAGPHLIGSDPCAAISRCSPSIPPCVARPEGNGLWLNSQMRQARPELVERRRVGRAVEQREIAELAGDRRARSRHAASRQLDRGDRVARGKAHLHRQLRARLDMRLHRAGALAVIDAERVAGLRLVEPGEHAPARPSRRTRRIGRPEEAHRRARAEAERHRDIDPGDHRADQRSPLMPPSRSAQPRAQASVAAIGCTTAPSWTGVEFLRVHLKGVDHRRVGRAAAARRCPRPWPRPGRRFAMSSTSRAPRRPGAGDADRERVGDEGFAAAACRVGHFRRRPPAPDARRSCRRRGSRPSSRPFPTLSPRAKGKGPMAYFAPAGW